MKILFSSISRLIFSYSKFFAGLILLSSINTFSNASELSTYIERNINYDKLIVNIIESHENIRTRKTNLIK